MKTVKLFSVAALAYLFFSCNPGQNKNMESNAASDSAATEGIAAKAPISTSAAVENNKDSVHKFIRTADLKFKVKDVVQSTYTIENITNVHGGFVTYTNLSSTIDNVTATPTSADSSLETTFYTPVNEITIRVPNTKLDTTLKDITKTVDYLNFRVIKIEDVSLQILANRLSQTRGIKNEQRLTNAIDNKGKKLKDITDAEETLSGKGEDMDNAKIANLSLSDKIQFSTVNISLYQRQAIKNEMVANYKITAPYQPGLGSQMAASFSFGWDIIEDAIIFVAKFWAIILIGILILLGFKKFQKHLLFTTNKTP